MNDPRRTNLEIIRNNLLEIQQKMADAYQRRSCESAPARLLAVTKYAQPEWIEALYELGLREFGESRPQQLVDRFELYTVNQYWDEIHWHLIGQLQRNKVKSILGKATTIHSVNSFRLLEKIEKECLKANKTLNVLLQVNLSGEASKQGFTADSLISSTKMLTALKHICVCGLMTMAPRSENRESIRTVFRDLREFRDELVQQTEGKLGLEELSMGMSGDYEIAIEEGATIVRIGSGLFKSCLLS